MFFTEQKEETIYFFLLNFKLMFLTICVNFLLAKLNVLLELCLLLEKKNICHPVYWLSSAFLLFALAKLKNVGSINRNGQLAYE